MRDVPREVDDAFYRGFSNETVRFVVNDTVEVTAGEHSGELAAVISIESLSPEPRFLVEFGDGSSDVVSQSHIQPA